MYTVIALLIAPVLTAGTPELVVDIDVNDEVMIREQMLTEGEIEQLVLDLHDHGATTLLVRMGYLGYLPYRTALSYPVGFDAEHARKYPYRRNLGEDELDEWIRKRAAANARYAEAIREFNPPEVFLRAGHELGMKVIFWIDLFDDGYTGHRSKFIDEHPQCQWTAPRRQDVLPRSDQLCLAGVPGVPRRPGP